MKRMCVTALAGCLFAAVCGVAPSARADLKPLAARVSVDERIGQQVPLDLPVVDQTAHQHRLGDYLESGEPLLLSLAYYHCPGLCDLSLRELAVRIRSLGFQLGADYRVLTISIDPHDTPLSAGAKRASVMQVLQRNEPAIWPFVISDAASLHTLTTALGYHYDYDAGTKQYAHPAVSVVLTPAGRVARYLYGPTLEARSTRLALREARLGRGGANALIDRTVLSCFQYDPSTHRYELLILGVMRGGAALIAFALAATVLVFVRRGRLRRGEP
jgi:protein SCO1/2